MEQATNQFNAGLQMDTHPMVQGNDTLTDALNATLITMNGNEVILQNDMGNRRVDNAFLPAGYEPVGIKEYGGIIYIAAYNPITNKSQIGSFPSPERKISPDDVKDDLQGTLNFDQLKNSEVKNKIKYLITDSTLVPLTSNNVLHAGDKFVVYCSDLPRENNNAETIKNFITNYYNTNGNKVNSPKNKLYTLYLGILNSQNEFVDITKTLCRWKISQNKPVMQEYTNQSELFRFNDGYFIASGKPDNLDYIETIDDAKLIKERQVMPANTYAYKLVGPLYLKAELNHIQDFNFNIYGNKISPTEADIYIEGYVIYNCPDSSWITSFQDNGDDNYAQYELGETNNSGWFNFIQTPENANPVTKNNDTSFNEVNKITYDPNTNLYSVKITKKYSSLIADDGTKIHYTLGVLPNNSFSDVYLEGLSQSGVIDIDKLGSGDLDLIGWRFYNALNSTTLSYAFDAYPKYKHRFQDLTFKFDQVGGNKTFTLDNLKIYNGRVTLNLDWENYPIRSEELYKVTITCKQKSEIEGSSSTNYTFIRWFLSTPLMNNCYIPNSDSHIEDYGNPQGDEETILDNLLTVKVSSNLSITNNSPEPEYSSQPTTGSWVVGNEEINIEYKHQQDIDISIQTETDVIEDLYPSFIRVSNTGVNTINFERAAFETDLMNTNIDPNRRGTYADSSLNDFIHLDNLEKTSDNKRIRGKISFYDKYKGSSKKAEEVSYPFGSVEKWLKKAIFYNASQEQDSPSNLKLDKYGGIGLDYDGDHHSHMLNVYASGNNQVQMIRTDGAEPDSSIGERIGHDNGDFSYDQKKTDIFEYFRSKLGNNTFTYVFEDLNDHENQDNRISKNKLRSQYSSSPSLKQYARVWWRTSSDDWALFPSMLGRNTSLWEFIKTGIFKTTDIQNLIYCFADSISGDQINVYMADGQNRIFNNKYQIEASLIITSHISNVTITGTTNSIQCGYQIGTGAMQPQKKIEFKNPNESNDSFVEQKFYIDSSEVFQDTVSEMTSNSDNKSYICIENGIEKDYKGNTLNTNTIYEIKNGKLYPLEIKNILISDQYTKSPGIKGILYNSNSSQMSLDYKYDTVGGSGSSNNWTVFDYTGAIVVYIEIKHTE